MTHRYSYPMDKNYAPAPLRLFKARDTRPLNTLSKCTNEHCRHDLSKFDLPPLNCPMCGKKTSTAPPLPPAGPGWGVDFRNSGGLMTDEQPMPVVEKQGYGYGAEGDGNVFCGDGRLGLRMDEWTCKEWEVRGTKLRIEAWRRSCGDEDCRGYSLNDEVIHYARACWDEREKLIRNGKKVNGRPRAGAFSIGRPLFQPERLEIMK